MNFLRYTFAFFVLCFIAIWFIGLHVFISLIPKEVEDYSTPSEAIVVLTGGTHRVHEALSLLNDKKGQSLFISGIGKGADLKTTLILSGELPDNILELVDHIELGFQAGNTYENAQEIAHWVKKNNIDSIRIVTSNYHTPRSLLEITAQLPETTIVPHPVFPSHVRLNEWWQHSGTLSLVLREYHKYIASQVRIALSFNS